jgi:hypothetical protein
MDSWPDDPVHSRLQWPIPGLKTFLCCKLWLKQDYRYRNPKIVTVFSAFVIISWLSLRVMAYNFCCIIPAILIGIRTANSILEVNINMIFRSILFTPSVFMIVLMCVLDILNLYWAYYIFMVAV